MSHVTQSRLRTLAIKNRLPSMYEGSELRRSRWPHVVCIQGMLEQWRRAAYLRG